MAYVKWKDPRRKPPRGAVIDRSDPITRGLVSCVLFQNEQAGDSVWKKQDLISENYIRTLGNAKINGEKVKLDGTDSTSVEITEGYGVPTPPPNFPALPPFTVFAEANNAVSQVTSCILGYRISGGGWGFKAQQGENTHSLGFTKFGKVDLVSSLSTPIGQKARYACVCYGDYSVSLFLDSKKEHINDTQPINYVNRYALIGASFNGSSFGDEFVGDIYCTYVWNRPLTDSEIRRLSDEPYSFFLVPVPRTYIVMGGGGDTIATVDTALLTISAVDVSVEANTNVTVDTAQLTVTAPDATAVVGGTNVSVDTAYLTITAPDVTAHGSAKVIVDTASLTITAHDVVVTTGAHVEVDTAYLTIQAYDVYVTTGTTFDPTFTILDKDGNGIEGAWVRIYAANNSLVAQGMTNSSGTVSFTGIADGTYRVIISHSQYQKYTITMYMQDGDDYKYRLYKRQPLGITPFGTFVKLKPEDPLGNIYG